jgi:hypothetical protein
MAVNVLENQTILHCGNCGGSFFEENVINRITVAETEKLVTAKETDDVSGADKLCMKDNSVMKPMSHTDNIPDEVTLLKCPACKSIFVFADDLITFKQAQEAKINYFKTWKMPIPSLATVVVLSFIALIAATIFSRSIYFQNNSIGSTQAQDIIKKTYVTKSGQYIFVSFTTQIPVTSLVLFKDITTGKTIIKTAMTNFTTAHYLTTGDFNPNDEIFYTIIIKDKNGMEVRNEEKKL